MNAPERASTAPGGQKKSRPLARPAARVGWDQKVT